MRCPLRVCLHSRHSQEKYKIDIVYYMYSYVHTYISIYLFPHRYIHMYTVEQLVVPWKLASVDCEFQYAATKQWTSNMVSPCFTAVFALSIQVLYSRKNESQKTDDEFAHGEMSQKASTFWYLLCHQGLLYIMFSIQTTWLGAFSYLDTSMSSPSWKTRPGFIE